MPTIHLENCTTCMKCVNDCPAQAIDIQSGTIDSNCIHCGHCVAICPESTITPDVGDIYPLKKSKISAGDYQDFSAGLRSTRKYMKKEIPQETLDLLLDNMKHYASASNSRPLKITIVRSPEKIQILNDLTLDAIIKPLKMIVSPWIRPFVRLFAPKMNISNLANHKDSFIERRKTNSSIVCHNAPVVLLFHGRIAKYGMLEADANIWATNTTNHAKTLGLGSCFIGFIVKAAERSKALRSEMQIPKDHKIYAALILGYPKVNYQNETSRQSPAVKYI